MRSATLTEPTSVTWPGGKRLVCDYRCGGCGHQCRRADLWTAKEAGFTAERQQAA